MKDNQETRFLMTVEEVKAGNNIAFCAGMVFGMLSGAVIGTIFTQLFWR